MEMEQIKATEHIYAYNETTANDPEGISVYRQRTIYRDENIPNRFWFQFPSEWRTSSNLERVIGVRACTMRCGDRKCRFTLKIRKTEVETGSSNELTLICASHITHFDSFDDLIKDIRFFINKARRKYEDQWKEDGIPIIEESDIGYTFERNHEKLMSLVIEGRDQYNLMERKAVEEEEEEEEEESTTPLYTVRIQMSELNKEMKNLLLVDELPEEYSRKIYFPGVWDRNPILLKSNLAVNSFRNYIGYTDRIYTPIKYFNLKSNDTYFWIEMYNGNDHITPAIIPLDGKDSFILEIVIC